MKAIIMERGVHAASTSALNVAFVLHSTLSIGCALKRRERRAPKRALPNP
jgi:hypothetical protein